MVFEKLKLIPLIIILFLLFVPLAFAEIKVFEKEVEEIVGRDQSQEQVEAFALQRAKRLAIEEAGTFISSLTIVKNHMLEKDEITALASGIVQAKVVGVPSVEVKNGVIHVKVKARIQVDTSILDRQIEEIMKEKGTLKKLEEERQKVKDLENTLAGLKSSDVKRLEELNAQALALEREREKQRLLLEEQSLKAKGELKKAEIERLQKEREVQERIAKTIAEQEKARKEEVEALAKEQDRLRRAQLENEQRWNELARKSQMKAAEWVPLDDSLSLRQAVEEAKHVKDEIYILKSRLRLQYEENKRNLQNAFKQQISLFAPKLPAQPVKDKFETTEEYKKRITDYQREVNRSRISALTEIEKLRRENNWKIFQTTREYMQQMKNILSPFIDRLSIIQKKKFILPEATITIELMDPEPDKSRFPLLFRYKSWSWKNYWEYKDREQARDIWETRAFLKGQGFFMLEEKEKAGYILSLVKVRHLGTDEEREFNLRTPEPFSEVYNFFNLVENEIPDMLEKEEKAKIYYEKALKSDFR